MSKKVKIILRNWDYTCSDGCCYDYGVSIEVNGEKCENEYSGDNVEDALKFTLNKLGYEVEIEIEHE